MPHRSPKLPVALFALFTALPARAQTPAKPAPSWHWENAAPTRWQIKAVRRTGVLVLASGERGLVIRSTDAGAAWTVVPTGSEVELDRLEAVGATDVYALGLDGGVVSNDEGRHFAPLKLGSPRVITAFYAPRPDDVRLGLCSVIRGPIAPDPPPGPVRGVLARSTDGGHTFVAEKGTWDDCWVALADLGETGLFAAGINGTILRHAGADAGWIEELASPIHDGRYEVSLTTLGKDDKGPFAIGEYTKHEHIGMHTPVTIVFRREVRGGRPQWVRTSERRPAVPAAPERSHPPRLDVPGAEQFLASWERAPRDLVGIGWVGFGRSLDGGQTWSVQPTIGRFAGIVRAGPRATIVGELGAQLKTSDGGRTWTFEKPRAWPPQPFSARFAVGTPERFFIGKSWDGRGIYGTHDGGRTWDLERLPDNIRAIDAMIVLPGDELYAVGYEAHLAAAPRAVVLHRASGALDFVDHYGPIPNPPGGLSFGAMGLWASGPDDVWACDTGGNLWHTTDRARTWSIRSASPGQLLAVGGAGPDEVYAVGEAGTIVRVRRGGALLDARPSSARGRLLAVWAGGGSVYVTSDLGEVLRSTDHGETFTRVLDAGQRLEAIAGEGTDVWIAGNRGIILHHY